MKKSASREIRFRDEVVLSLTTQTLNFIREEKIGVLILFHLEPREQREKRGNFAENMLVARFFRAVAD